MNRRRLAGLACVVALAAPARAQHVVQGVDVPLTVTVDGKELRHNGTGVRKKFVVKVYVGTLYLEEPSRSADAIIAADRVKSVRMVFLRDVSREQVMDAFRDGFRNNSPADAERLAPKLDALARAIPGEMKERTSLTISYVPGKGSLVSADGATEVVIEGKDFADALLRNWLGPSPADDGLKKRMLGG